jgi:hypothetical protein
MIRGVVSAALVGALGVACTTEFPTYGGADARLDARADLGPTGGVSDAGLEGGAVGPTGGASPAIGGAEPPSGGTGPEDLGRPADAAAPDVGVPLRDAAPVESDAACSVSPETCNGLDDDCDGLPDDGVCGPLLAERCRVFLVWANEDFGPVGPVPTWGACPGSDYDVRDPEYFTHASACVSTARDQRFHAFPFGGGLLGDVNENDNLGLAFRCDPAPEAPGVPEWVERNCRVYFGHYDAGAPEVAERVPLDAETWGPCPAAEGTLDAYQCLSTGGDGQFRSLDMTGDVDQNDLFSVSFRCEAPPGASAAEVQRAEVMSGALEVFLAFAQNDVFEDASNVETWDRCPGLRRDDGPRSACVSTAGDGAFHALTTYSFATLIDWQPDVDVADWFGIALIAGAR